MNGTPKNCSGCHYARQCNSWYGGTGCMYRNKIVKHKRGNAMKKIIAFILTIMLVASMTVSAYAVTPRLKVPSMPKVPKITFQWNWGR